jgi:hypothetical protein
MDVMKALRDRSPELASRVVFMTGGVFTEAAREFLATVPNMCVDKPFDLTALQAIVTARGGGAVT